MLVPKIATFTHTLTSNSLRSFDKDYFNKKISCHDRHSQIKSDVVQRTKPDSLNSLIKLEIMIFKLR